MPWWGDVRWVSWDVLTGPLNALDFISCDGELVVVKWWWWYFLGFSILPSPSVIIHVEVRWLPWEVARPDTRASAQTDRLHFAAKYQNIVFAKHCFLKHLATQTKGCSYGEAKTWLSKHCFLFVKLFVASKLRLGLHNWTLMYTDVLFYGNA